jgi:hypothetical protein
MGLEEILAAPIFPGQAAALYYQEMVRLNGAGGAIRIPVRELLEERGELTSKLPPLARGFSSCDYISLPVTGPRMVRTDPRVAQNKIGGGGKAARERGECGITM